MAQQPPTQPGWYWFDGVDIFEGEPNERREIVCVTNTPVSTTAARVCYWFAGDEEPWDAAATEKEALQLDHAIAGRWWGPLPPPWDDTEPGQEIHDGNA